MVLHLEILLVWITVGVETVDVVIPLVEEVDHSGS